MKKIFKNIATCATAAIAAVVMVATVYAGETIVMDGSTTVGPLAKAFAEFYMRQNPGVNITVGESGSGNGAKSMINKTCQVANMSRFMKDTEFKAAVNEGILPVAHVIALDGMPILVHPSNPVQNLTVAQVRQIYTGQITNWKQVGGPDLGIVRVSRDTNSGTYECFNELVMNKEKISDSAEYVGSNGGIRQRVQSTPAAVGYAGLGFVDDTVKALSINGIAPTEATVRNGSYPIARPLFMFTDGYPKLGSHLQRLVTLCLTEEGNSLIKETGFIATTDY